MDTSASPSAGDDGWHPLTSARPMRQSAIHEGSRARACRTCGATFRIDTVFIVQHRDIVGSVAAVCAVDHGVVVGMGRLVGDGAMC